MLISVVILFIVNSVINYQKHKQKTNKKNKSFYSSKIQYGVHIGVISDRCYGLFYTFYDLVFGKFYGEELNFLEETIYAIQSDNRRSHKGKISSLSKPNSQHINNEKTKWRLQTFLWLFYPFWSFFFFPLSAKPVCFRETIEQWHEVYVVKTYFDKICEKPRNISYLALVRSVPHRSHETWKTARSSILFNSNV